MKQVYVVASHYSVEEGREHPHEWTETLGAFLKEENALSHVVALQEAQEIAVGLYESYTEAIEKFNQENPRPKYSQMMPVSNNDADIFGQATLTQRMDASKNYRKAVREWEQKLGEFKKQLIAELANGNTKVEEVLTYANGSREMFEAFHFYEKLEVLDAE